MNSLIQQLNPHNAMVNTTNNMKSSEKNSDEALINVSTFRHLSFHKQDEIKLKNHPQKIHISNELASCSLPKLVEKKN